MSRLLLTSTALLSFVIASAQSPGQDIQDDVKQFSASRKSGSEQVKGHNSNGGGKKFSYTAPSDVVALCKALVSGGGAGVGGSLGGVAGAFAGGALGALVGEHACPEPEEKPAPEPRLPTNVER